MAIDLSQLLAEATQMNVSDIHLTVGSFPRVRRIKQLHDLEHYGKLSAEDTEDVIKQCLSQEKLKDLYEKGEVDSSFSRVGVGRYRVNAFRQRGTYACAIRIQPFEIPNFDDLSLPSTIKEFSELSQGLVLLTGVTGSGKSTTLASIIDMINSKQRKHIITIEDPIEYLHRHKESIVNQREVGLDSKSFASALRAALREDPDVILVGEMRDLETTQIAITAAETGHLVFSTMHTMGAAKTIDRVLDIFPADQQNQIRNQLSTVLKGVVTQQLVPKIDGSGVQVVCEVMKLTPAISNLIREGKPYQINSVIQTSIALGMISMDNEMVRLYKTGNISRHEVLSKCIDRKVTMALLNNN